MNVLFIIDGELTINHWSGTTYAIFNHLQSFCNLDLLEIPLDNIRKIEVKMYNKLHKGLSFGDRTPSLMRYRRKLILKRLRKKSYDAIFCVGSLVTASVPDYFSMPVYVYVDGVMKLMEGYYWNNVNEKSFDQANKLEQLALNRVLKSKGKIFAASDWVRNGCCTYYNISNDYISVVKIGANNLDPASIDQIEKWNKERVQTISSQLELLFVGYDWKRKGLSEAFYLLRLLKKAGVKVKLHIVGCNPDIPSDIVKDTIVYGQLKKDNKDDKERLIKLYCSCHFFVFPTHAECVGAVICEASSYSLPILANSTGGIPSLIADGENGWLLNLKDMNIWKNKVIYYINNVDSYNHLLVSTYQYYLKNLSWDVICNKMFSVMENT